MKKKVICVILIVWRQEKGGRKNFEINYTFAELALLIFRMYSQTERKELLKLQKLDRLIKITRDKEIDN